MALVLDDVARKRGGSDLAHQTGALQRHVLNAWLNGEVGDDAA